MISFIYSSFKIILYFQEIVCTSMAMCFSNNKQIYPYAYCASLVCFTVELLHLSMIQNCFDHIKPGICFKNTHTHKIKIELLFSSSLLHILGPLSMFHQSMNQLSSLLTWDIYCLYQNPQKIDSNHQIWKSYMWYTSIEVRTLVY